MSRPQPDHPCSACPFLDLGHQYPVKHPDDPWRRMPALFDAATKVFGRTMFNHTSRSRLRLEKILGFYCRAQRERYGGCTRKRSLVCQRIVGDAIRFGATAPTQSDRYARTIAALRRAVNDEETIAQMKATRPPVQPALLPMPPVTLRTIPRDDQWASAA